MYVINDTDIKFVVGAMTVLPETIQPFDETSEAYTKFFADPVVSQYVRKKQIRFSESALNAESTKFMYFRSADGTKQPSYGVCQVCGCMTDLWTGRHIGEGSTEHVWVDNIQYVDTGILAMTTDHSTYDNGTWLIGS